MHSYFGGFVSQKQAARRKMLESLAMLDCTLVFYEAPHRILETLQDIAEIYGDREIVLTRELTKLHEEFLRGTALALFRNLQDRESVKGEITLIIGKPVAKPDDRPLREAFDAYLAHRASPEWMRSRPSRKTEACRSARSTRRSNARIAPVIGVRRFVAILCLAAILVLAWNPASFGLLCAVLLPVGIWIGFVSSYSDRSAIANPATPASSAACADSRRALLPFCSPTARLQESGGHNVEGANSS